MAHKELVLVVLLGLVARGLSTSCFGCPFDCGDPPAGCRYGNVRDVCGCCTVCAQGPFEECGHVAGQCGDGLECAPPPPGSHSGQGRCEYINSHDTPGWTRARNACIIGHNEKQFTRVNSLDDCRSRCQAFGLGFNCKSVEYHSGWRRCVLSKADSNNFFYRDPCSSSDWVFTEVIENSHPFCAVEGNSCIGGVCRTECDYGSGEYVNPLNNCGGNNCVCCARDTPPSDEFTIGSQTFVVLRNRKGVTWDTARDACFNRGFDLAEPDNLRSTAEYLLRNYGLTYYWLGGRGTGFSIKWNKGSVISRRSTLWRTDYQTSRDYCVYLRDDGLPNPLGTFPCSDTTYLVPLCEVNRPPPAPFAPGFGGAPVPAGASAPPDAPPVGASFPGSASDPLDTSPGGAPPAPDAPLLFPDEAIGEDQSAP